MSETIIKKPVDETRLGECAATQPLSGISRVNGTFALQGHGRGAYVRMEEAGKGKKRA